MKKIAGDTWLAWLDEQRFSGGEQEDRLKATLYEYRETVLDHANIAEDDTVLDVGAGDGLVAFGALDRIGPDGAVILNDVSAAVLGQARATAEELGVVDQCEFVIASAQDLEPIDDESVDAVTLRSVLIFVEEKEQAFSEFKRVLKSGGRLSIYEPVGDFTREMQGPKDVFMGYDMDRIDQEIPDPVRELYRKIRGYAQDQSPNNTTAMNFDERDLFAFAERAGFEDVHLDLHARNTRFYETEEWDAWLTTSFGPGTPTKEEAMNETLTAEERETFIEYVRPLVESKTPKLGLGTEAYLRATKPDR